MWNIYSGILVILTASCKWHHQRRRDNDTVNSLRHSQPFHKLRTRTTRFRNCFSVLYHIA